MTIGKDMQEARDKRADALISGKTRDAVLREVADGTIEEGDEVGVLDVVRALVRRIDRKEAARAAKTAEGG